MRVAHSRSANISKVSVYNLLAYVLVKVVRV